MTGEGREWSAAELVQTGAEQLRTIGSTSARLEAQLLLGRVAGWTRTELLAHPEWRLSTAQRDAYADLLARRAAAEPVAYLLGQREFYGRAFKVDRRALIPRPETELLVDLGKAAVTRWRASGIEPRVVELGTGCGAVAISLAAEMHIRVVATDISRAALLLAKENAGMYAPGSVQLVQADLASSLRGRVHVLLANLPYVPANRDLPADVRDFEPHVAIFGGPRGTELIERLLRDARTLLARGAELAVELDEEDQATPMAALARQLYPEADVAIRQDAGGYDRVVHVTVQ